MGAQSPARIRLSRVIGGLSYALDVTEGEPPGHAVRSCVIGMRIADELGLDAATRSHLFYALLMKDAGCTANSAKMAALFDADDHEAKRTAKRSNWSRAVPAFLWSLRTVAPEGSLRARAERLKAIKDEGQVTHSLMLARCDRGAEIALLLGLEPETADAIRALDEHWDGNGQPQGLRGEEIPLLARIVCLAQTAEIFHGEGGPAVACAVAARRSGEWFDPDLVAVLHSCRHDTRFWLSLRRADISMWEPEDRLMTADDAHLDRIATAFAGVIDVKSPWTYRHSDLVAVLATRIAAALGADEAEVTDLRRAAMLHDIGKLAISNRILDKAAGLTDAERAQVRQHPLVTARILERIPGFAHLAPLAAAHHERLDGSGYPHGLRAENLTTPMRVLAVADVFEAMTSARPYRPGMGVDAALGILRADAAHARPRGRRRARRRARHARRRQPAGLTCGPESACGMVSPMRAFTLDEFDSPPRLRDDLPEPSPADDQVLVRVQASSANPVDNAIAAGMLNGMVEHTFPVVLGRDYAGVVEQVGSAVSGYAPGDEVFGMLTHADPTVQAGTWTDLIALTEAKSIAPQAQPAWPRPTPARRRSPRSPRSPRSTPSGSSNGDTVLIVGATGGVGSFAVQLAAAAGASVIAPGLPEDEEYLRGLGVTDLVAREGDVAAAVRERHPDGVDALIELVSYTPDGFDAYAAALKPGGRGASPLGAAGDGEGRANVGAEPTAENLKRLGGLLEAGTLKVPIQARFALDQAGEALQALATTAHPGQAGDRDRLAGPENGLHARPAEA